MRIDENFEIIKYLKRKKQKLFLFVCRAIIALLDCVSMHHRNMLVPQDAGHIHNCSITTYTHGMHNTRIHTQTVINIRYFLLKDHKRK